MKFVEEKEDDWTQIEFGVRKSWSIDEIAIYDFKANAMRTFTEI